MKKKLIASIILALVMAASCLPVYAAEDQNPPTVPEYKYTVTVYGGDQGTVNGKAYDSIEVDYKQEINLNDYFTPALNDEGGKYYIKGFRLSGRDNNTVPEEPVFEITKDTDFVVAYGIKGSMVKYTVNYVDKATGNQIGAKSKEFYGNAGELPIVAFLYIDGYRPSFENFKTVLSAKDNMTYTFKYEKVELPKNGKK